MPSPRSSVGVVLALLALAAPAPAFAQSAPPPPPARGEAILEGRLRAPCCWTQTLDVHESELAASLRDEVRSRLSSGEAAVAIEDDLVARYGDRIRAVPKGGDVRIAVPIVTATFVTIAGLALSLLLFRWTRRSSNDHDRSPSKARARDGYDDRIDDALRELDG
jgi:cytochrome c-type biogenesis protein CcmH